MNDGLPLIEARGLGRTLEETIPVTLVAEVDLVIRKSEFIAVTGPSGSGKSSLLYLLGLLDRPTTGEVFVDGEPTSKLEEEERARIRLKRMGFIFQFHFLLPEFSALDNVLVPMRALGKLGPPAMKERAASILQTLGLDDHLHKRPDQLSGGQRQRVAVARALGNDPEILFADEPTGSLDSHSTEQVFAILRDLVEQHGKTVVAVTHAVDLAQRMHRQIQVVDGRIAADEKQTLPA